MEGQGWTPAGELQSGNRLSTATGDWLPVESITNAHQPVPVYNFRVSDFHTYFIAPADAAFDVWVHNSYGARAIDAGHAYEHRIRSIYGEVTLKQRRYQSIVDGRTVSGIADDVVTEGGKRTAIEAKYVKDWATSLRNPRSPIGGAPFARAERRALVNQASAYANQFDEVIYHSNSLELINHYDTVFRRLNIKNIHFVHTP